VSINFQRLSSQFNSRRALAQFGYGQDGKVWRCSLAQMTVMASGDSR
jgi:hypothetical protein